MKHLRATGIRIGMVTSVQNRFKQTAIDLRIEFFDQQAEVIKERSNLFPNGVNASLKSSNFLPSHNSDRRPLRLHVTVIPKSRLSAADHELERATFR